MAASDAAVHYKPKKGAYRRRTMARGFKPVRVKRRTGTYPRGRALCDGECTRTFLVDINSATKRSQALY